MNQFTRRLSWLHFKLLSIGIVVLLACAVLLAQAPGSPTGVAVTLGLPPVPAITLLNPNSGVVGATVAITGSGFNATRGIGNVTFNGVQANVTAWSATSITVTVPNTTTGNVVVNQNNLASPGVPFAVSGSAACNQTFSSTSGLATAVANAANGTTICLTNGSYSLSLSNITRTGFVTLQAQNAYGATLNSLSLNTSSFIQVKNFVMSGGSIGGCSKNVQLLRNHWNDGSTGLGIDNRGDNCTNYPANILVDGNTFGDVNHALDDGRIDIADDQHGSQPWGVTISNNSFTPGCQADAVHTTGGSTGGRGLTISGNIFDGIVSGCGPHADMIQIWSNWLDVIIEKNWFKNGGIAVLTHHTSVTPGTIFRNNLVTNCAQIQVDQSPNFLYEHNTVWNLNLDGGGYYALHSQAGGSVTVRNNLSAGNTVGIDTTGGATTVSYMLCQTSGQCMGSNSTVGTPVFVGGNPANISTGAGWQLAPGSPGKGAGSDGLDRGTTYYGPYGANGI